jgi:hypothetical protein
MGRNEHCNYHKAWDGSASAGEKVCSKLDTLQTSWPKAEMTNVPASAAITLFTSVRILLNDDSHRAVN